MIICLGPVCVPVWPLIFLGLKPLWNLLPEATQQSLKRLWDETIYPKCIAPWFSRLPTVVQNFLTLGMKKKKRECSTEDTGASAEQQTLVPGEVAPISSMEEWESLRSSEELIFVKFTAEWCKPCKEMQPQYCALAQGYPKVRFVTVDIDLLGEISDEHQVAAIPAIYVFRGVEKVDSLTMVTAAKLEAFVQKHAA